MLKMDQPNKLGLSDVRQKFSALVRDRKADNKPFAQYIIEKMEREKNKDRDSNSSPGGGLRNSGNANFESVAVSKVEKTG